MFDIDRLSLGALARGGLAYIRREWNLYAAIAIAVLIVSLSAAENSKQRPSHEGQSDPCAQSSPPPVPVACISGIANTEANEADSPPHEKPDWIAIFTFVLTIATIALWLETRRLAKGAETQSSDFKTSLEHLKAQADATVDSVNLAREQFIANNRPWLKISEIEHIIATYIPGEGERPEALNINLEYSVQNLGNGPAINVGMFTKVLNVSDMDAVSAHIEHARNAIVSVHEVLYPTDALNAARQLHVPSEFLIGDAPYELGFLLVYRYEMPGRKDVFITPVLYRVSFKLILPIPDNFDKLPPLNVRNLNREKVEVVRQVLNTLRPE